jgi:LEA14-like dessication related protein
MLSACAGLPGAGDPVRVTVADIESLPSEGLEFRMLVKLRVQNPNDSPIEYDGVSLRLDVQDRTFATGVSDERGTVARFGETVVSVPVTVSALSLAQQAIGVLNAERVEKLTYRMEGKLNGPLFGSTRFEAQGEMPLMRGVQPR